MSVVACLFCLIAATTSADTNQARTHAGTTNIFLAQNSNSRGSLNYRTYTLNFYKYTGDCPGSYYGNWTDISFLGSVPPGPYQRVKITNMSTGGFTDREYDERRSRSEPFSMRWLDRHDSKHLAVQEGSNQFAYQIRNRKTGIVDQGNFTIDVEITRKTSDRSFREITQELYCEGERDKTSSKTSISECKEGYYIAESTGHCPDGNKQRLSLRKRPI